MSTRVSVVIPTIGRPELLRAYRSVRNQTVDAAVIVVLDDPDREVIVRDMLGSDLESGDAFLVVTTGRVGGAAARNIGLDLTDTEYVAFLDDDDWWDTDKLEQQLEMVTCTGATLCFTAVDFVDGDRHRVLPEESFDPERESVASYLVRRPRLRHGYGYLQSSTILAATTLAQRVRWDDALPKHQDWDFVIRLMADPESGFAFCGAPLVHVQKGSASSISVTRNRQASEKWWDRHARELDSKARGDFVATQLLRAATANRDLRGVMASLKMLRHNPPSPAALVVGFSGIRETPDRRRQLASPATNAASESATR